INLQKYRAYWKKAHEMLQKIPPTKNGPLRGNLLAIEAPPVSSPTKEMDEDSSKEPGNDSDNDPDKDPDNDPDKDPDNDSNKDSDNDSDDGKDFLLVSFNTMVH